MGRRCASLACGSCRRGLVAFRTDQTKSFAFSVSDAFGTEGAVATSGERAGRARPASSGSGDVDGHEPGGPPGAGGLPQASWRKSSHSGYNGSCVEVARLDGIGIGVRDTKNRGAGPVLIFGAEAWDGFLSGVKSGEFTVTP
jgi:Domain of unknown function (DUF397)